MRQLFGLLWCVGLAMVTAEWSTVVTGGGGDVTFINGVAVNSQGYSVVVAAIIFFHHQGRAFPLKGLRGF